MDIVFEDEYMRIKSCERAEYKVMLEAYNKYRKGYVFDPMYKRKIWDGRDHVITKDTKDQIPIASYLYLKDVLESTGFQLNELNENPLIDDIDFGSFCEWVETFFKNSEKFPRDYQITAAYNMLTNSRCMAMLATSAGKTLISFIVFAYLIDVKKVKNILMIVPSTTLLKQTTGDFNGYKKGTKLTTMLRVENPKNKALPRVTIRPLITVSTFQTACKFNASDLKDYGCVMIDECHKGTCDSIKQILNMAKDNHIKYRFGLSGTIPDTTYSDGVSLVCNIGSIVTRVTAKELQDQEFISTVSIAQLRLDYTSPNEKADYARAKALLKGQGKMLEMIQVEKNLVTENGKRINYIVKLAKQCPGNVMILFYELEYGQKLVDAISQNTDKKVYYIAGDIDGKQRDEIRLSMEGETGTVLVGSFGCVSTGFSLTNLNTVMFVSSYKSESMVLQSVGRSLRRNAEIGKTSARIIDVADSLYDGCYQIKQANERLKLYAKECFECKVFNMKI